MTDSHLPWRNLRPRHRRPLANGVISTDPSRAKPTAASLQRSLGCGDFTCMSPGIRKADSSIHEVCRLSPPQPAAKRYHSRHGPLPLLFRFPKRRTSPFRCASPVGPSTRFKGSAGERGEPRAAEVFMRLRSIFPFSTPTRTPRRPLGTLTIGQGEGGLLCLCLRFRFQSPDNWLVVFPKGGWRREPRFHLLLPFPCCCTHPSTGVWRLGHWRRRSGRALSPCHG